MTCPSCGLALEQASISVCPRCGQFLSSTPGASENYGPPLDQLSQAPTLFSGGPPPAAPGAWPAGYAGPPSPSQSAPPPSSGYSQYPTAGSPSRPMAGGFPPTPSMPLAGSMPPMPFPPPAPPRKSRAGIIIGVLVVIIVLLAGGLGITLHTLKGQSGNSATKGTAATSTPVPTATPNETRFFQDPLTSNQNGWAADSHCFFQNSAYHIRDGYLCYAPIGTLADLSVSVDVQQVSGPDNWFYGIVLRRASKGNYYVFDIDSRGKWLFGKVVNNTYSDILPYRPDPAIKTGLNVRNTLLVRTKGTHFDFYVNGTKVGETDDATFASGKCGVHGDSHLEAAFNNFIVNIPQT
jgi:hypothetical protein